MFITIIINRTSQTPQSHVKQNQFKQQKNNNKQAQRRAAAETVARKPIEHFIHDK